MKKRHSNVIFMYFTDHYLVEKPQLFKLNIFFSPRKFLHLFKNLLLDEIFEKGFLFCRFYIIKWNEKPYYVLFS